MADDPKPPADVIFIPDTDSPGTLEQVFEQPDVKKITPSRDAPPPTKTPAVHSDAVWGGPRWVHNAEAQPVWVETKAEYWALLRKNGMRMLDQQESTTGDTPGPVPTLPTHLTAHPPIAPLTQPEAEVFGAITAVYRRYGLRESLWCAHCFARHVPHGMRCRVESRVVYLECRGGIAQWRTPVGETNLVLSSLANATITRNDRVTGTVRTPVGQEFRPAQLLLPQEAEIIRAFVRVCSARGIEPRWHHEGCWSGDAWHEDDAMAMQISETQIVCVCRCFQLFDRSTRAGAEDVVN